jgi:hypothetical protein
MDQIVRNGQIKILQEVDLRLQTDNADAGEIVHKIISELKKEEMK